MSWRFRKTFKVLPGVKLNLTRQGLSATLGAAPFSVNVGRKGVYSNVSIPGTGVWDRQRIDIPSQAQPNDQRHAALDHVFTALPTPPAPLAFAPGGVIEIRSASTVMLKSQSMADLQKLLEEAYDERSTLESEIEISAREADVAARRYRSWESGFLFKRMFSKSFATRKDIFETTQAKLDELREQLNLTVVATHIDIDGEPAESYYRMRDDFAAMCESKMIWDTLDRRPVDRFAERSAASEAITREPVSFELASCDLIQWDQKALHLPNRTGGDLYIYPGFALYRAAKKAFAIIDFREIKLISTAKRFIEDGRVPSDARVVDKAWAKSNKDGSPDRRFRDNYQMPVALYGSLRFTSPGGLQEEFQISNAEVARRFSMAWNRFQSSFAPGQQRVAGNPSAVAIQALSPPAKRTDAPIVDAAEAFSNESENARRLALEHGPLWEFLLTEELLRSRLALLEKECREFDQTLLSTPRTRFNGPEFMRWLGRKIGETSPMLRELARYVNDEIKSSWGALGESGNAIQILQTVDGMIASGRAFLIWELDVCAAEPPAQLKRLGDAFRGITLSIVGDLNGLTEQLHRAIEDVKGGSQTLNVNIEFTSPAQLAKFNAEMERIKKHPEWVSG